MKKTKIITFIGGFYIFGGIVVLLSLLLNGSPMNTVFDLPDSSNHIVKLLIGIIYVPLGYLFLKRIRFSNWIVLVLAILTFCISAELATKFDTQQYIGNTIYELFVIIATMIRRNEFVNDINSVI